MIENSLTIPNYQILLLVETVTQNKSKFWRSATIPSHLAMYARTAYAMIDVIEISL